LCEIINKPEKFVCNNPFYVVEQVDWIQCRYLFVQKEGARPPMNMLPVLNTPAPVPAPMPAPVPAPVSIPVLTPGVEYVQQDPGRIVKGPNGVVIRIPIAALPSSRRDKSNATAGSSATRPILIDDDDDDDDDSDPEKDEDERFLLSDDDGASMRDDASDASSAATVIAR
jgi:ubiquitin-conjugating enzyme E2 Q